MIPTPVASSVKAWTNRRAMKVGCARRWAGEPDESGTDQSGVEEASEVTGRSAGRRRWPYLLLAVVLWTVGSVGVGAVLGYRYFLANRVEPAPEVTIDIDPPLAVTEGPTVAAPEVVMPDLVGLDRRAALEAIGDLGLDPTTVPVEERAQVGPVDVVVDQEPLGGTQDPTAPSLVVSTAATMPALVGMSEQDATSALVELGAEVQREGVFEPDAETGEVLATQPESGAAMDRIATLTVAAAPQAIYVTALDPIDRECRVDDGFLAGQQYADALRCPVRRDDPTVQEYVLRGDALALAGTIGLGDDQELDRVVLVEVANEDEVLVSEQSRFGEPVTIDVDLTGALRLQIRLSLVEPEDAFSTDVIGGDLRLVGSADSVDALVEP